MNKKGPIVIIEDDSDDQEILVEIFKKIGSGNEIIFFSDGQKALEFLTETDLQPFLILSDINMPRINGFELRNKVFTNKQLQMRCIPYLFFTTTATKQSVIDAYALSVQGFFVKPRSVNAWESTLRRIIDYWQDCTAPGEFTI